MIAFDLNATAQSSPEAQFSRVDDYVRERMQALHIPGLSLAVVREGKVVKASGYGLANLETNTPAAPETVYKTASLSKPFIASAIMLLVQEGKIGLDDKVDKYLDGSPQTWKEISVRHLLTHTSGIVRDPLDYRPYNDQPTTEVIQSAYALPLSFRPGEKWLYSNVGYYALAEIITRASGEPWDQFIAEHIFAPAHMNATRTTTVTEIIPGRASGYVQRDNRTVNAENWIAVRPSGAFLSTVLDLAKWDAFLYSDTELKPSSRRTMWTPTTLKDKKIADYGFGWYVDSFLGHARIHHDGQFPGFRSDYEHFDDEKLTVIVLANSDGASVESMAIQIAGFFSPTLVQPTFTLNADVPVQTFGKGSSVTIRISARDDGNAAPDSVVEMEIRDESGKTVYKQHEAGANFYARQTKTFTFSWIPAGAGNYSINVGVYGPQWVSSYAWKSNAAVITVN